jgi:glutamate transport system substrate-binding protein
MRRRRWFVPAIVVVVGLMGAACSSSGDSPTVSGSGSSNLPTFPAGSPMAQIQQKGKLVVGTKFDQPGLGAKNPVTGQVEGFDVEIAKIIGGKIFGVAPDKLGDKIEFKEATTPNRELFIENGNVDIVVATYTINDARKLRIDFAGPYYIAGQDIMVKSDNNTITGVGDLAGKKVCSVLNSTPAKRIKEQAPQAQLTELETYSACKDGLLDGRYDAVSTDNSILLGFIAADPTHLKVVGNQFSQEPYGIGLQRGQDVFREFVNKTLEDSYADGTWKAAFESTLGKLGVPTPPPPPVDRYTSAGPTTTGAPGATTTIAAGATTTVAPTTVAPTTTAAPTTSTTA